MKSRIEQLEIEIAFEKGAKIESRCNNNSDWNLNSRPEFYWEMNDYRIKEEPKRIPFDGSDAFDLLGQKFQNKINKNLFRICIASSNEGITLNKAHQTFEELESDWLKWNDLLKVFEPCNKTV